MAQTGDLTRFTAFVRPEAQTRDELESKVKNYEKLYDDKEGGIEKRKESYTSMVNSFYDLVTNFYEWGWGHSFHFAPRNHWETWEASIARHEMYLAHRLQLTQGKVALDVGCGIGGPGRTMARFSEATVVGLNNNSYQLERARHHTRTQRLEGQCKYMKGDFMHIPEKDDTFDAAFAIEATCHAPDKVGVYSEIARVLKPGGFFGTYEWVMTKYYDPKNERHNRIKKGIEVGNGLPDLEPVEHVVNAVTEAGLTVLEEKDMAESNVGDHDMHPWYQPLEGSFSFSGFKHTRVGRTLTHHCLRVLEACYLAPKGTVEVSRLLMETANDLVDGGRLRIFTPMHFILAQKPQKK